MYRLEEHLRKMAKPNLELPKNHLRLRQLILKKTESRANSFLNMFYKLLAPGIAMGLLLFLGSMLITEKSPVNPIITSVSAAEIMVNNALEKVKNLSPEKFEEISQKMNLSDNSEIISILKNAKMASDLEIIEPSLLSCEQASAIIESPSEKNRLITDMFNLPCEKALIWRFNENTPEGFDFLDINGSLMHFVKYTDGKTPIAVGIDEAGLPIRILNLNPDQLHLTSYNEWMPVKGSPTNEVSFSFPAEYEDKYKKIEGTGFGMEKFSTLNDDHVYFGLSYKHTGDFYDVITFDEPIKFEEQSLSQYLIKTLPNRDLQPVKDEDYIKVLEDAGWQHIVTTEREIWLQGLFPNLEGYESRGWILDKDQNKILPVFWTFTNDHAFNYQIQSHYEDFVDIIKKVKF